MALEKFLGKKLPDGKLTLHWKAAFRKLRVAYTKVKGSLEEESANEDKKYTVIFAFWFQI